MNCIQSCAVLLCQILNKFCVCVREGVYMCKQLPCWYLCVCVCNYTETTTMKSRFNNAPVHPFVTTWQGLYFTS